MSTCEHAVIGGMKPESPYCDTIKDECPVVQGLACVNGYKGVVIHEIPVHVTVFGRNEHVNMKIPVVPTESETNQV